MSITSLDDVLALATGSQGTNSSHVSNALKQFVRKDKDAAEIMLSGAAGSGQDPLHILAPNIHTIPYLYILCVQCASRFLTGFDTVPCRSARLTHSATTVPIAVIENFCRTAEPVQLRHAPERGMYLIRRVDLY